MAAASGRDRASVADGLRQEAYRFDFFQAVRLLEWMALEQPEAAEPRRPVGQDYRPDAEVVRFRAMPSLGFPTGSIRELRRPEGAAPSQTAGPPEMIVEYMGLFGPSGPLPPHYTALVIQRIREKDFSLRDFLDLFNHRTVSLFYRTWEKYRFTIAYERTQRTAGKVEEDLFTQCLYCLIGWGTGGLRGRPGTVRRTVVDDEALLFYAGHFAHFPRSALGLEMVLADYFELPVEIRQFRGQWLYLSADDQCQLPRTGAPPGTAKRVGDNLVVGQRVWDVQSKFRVRLGPLGYREFRRFMPSGDALRPLCQMTRSYAGPQWDFDVQPVLKAAEVPWCRIGGEGADPGRLGWNTWIRSRDMEHDVDDAVFSLEG
jgi:type VI secretion system protein ImpH